MVGWPIVGLGALLVVAMALIGVALRKAYNLGWSHRGERDGRIQAEAEAEALRELIREHKDAEERESDARDSFSRLPDADADLLLSRGSAGVTDKAPDSADPPAETGDV